MNDNQFESIKKFKEFHKISDHTSMKIAEHFQVLYEEFLQDGIFSEFSLGIDTENEEERLEVLKNRQLEDLLGECTKTNPSLIPYSELTNIIFTEGSMFSQVSDTDTSFPEKLKSDMENFITKKYNKGEQVSRPQNNDDIFVAVDPTDNYLEIDKDTQNGLLVFYKIIQHTELAFSQKVSLYEDQKNKIDNLDKTIKKSSESYNNMMSSFISILGIFAAIMVATFGGIQGFTALFTNESNHSLTEIFLISSFGLFGLLSIIYLLFYSIDKLSGRSNEFTDFDYDIYPRSIFDRYPVYSHSIFISGIFFQLALTHQLKTNKPNYLPDHIINNLWAYSIIFLLLAILFYFTYTLFKNNSGHYYLDQYLNQFVHTIKNKVTTKWIVMTIIIAPLLLIIMIIIGIFILGF